MVDSASDVTNYLQKGDCFAQLADVTAAVGKNLNAPQGLFATASAGNGNTRFADDRINLLTAISSCSDRI
ncbi:MAG: hypothetical protein R3C05_11980 [Pirellulaceae bacterium]